MKAPLTLAALFAAAVLPAAASSAGSVRVEIKDPQGKAVADAVAYLAPLDSVAPIAPPAAPVLIEQQGEEFRPYVTVVVAGTRVNFPNRDRVQHHVYSLSKAKKFDLPLFQGEPKDPVLFDQPGVVSLGCNIHDWMSAYVVVLATPYFAKSADDGVVTLRDLPAGRYRLEVWHPRIKAVLQRDVAVAQNDTSTQLISVTLGVDRRIRRAPDASGGSYK